MAESEHFFLVHVVARDAAGTDCASAECPAGRPGADEHGMFEHESGDVKVFVPVARRGGRTHDADRRRAGDRRARGPTRVDWTYGGAGAAHVMDRRLGSMGRCREFVTALSGTPPSDRQFRTEVGLAGLRTREDPAAHS